MDHILQAGVEKGQSIAHIVKNNAKSIPYSERHVYTLIEEQKLSVKKHDLKRAIRYAPRKHNVQKREYATKIRTNRRYSDFLKEITKNPFMNVVEMDKEFFNYRVDESSIVFFSHFLLLVFLIPNLFNN